MNEYKSLLQSVLDAPDDDLPRGVLADWLDDHGYEARAATIRWGLENPKEHCIGGIWKNFEWSKWPGSEIHGFVSTSASFVPRHLNATLWRDNPWVNFYPRDVTYVIRRGFIDEIRAPLGELIFYGPRIARRQPLRRVAYNRSENGAFAQPTLRFDEWTRFYLAADRGYVVSVPERDFRSVPLGGDLSPIIQEYVLKAILAERRPVIGPRVYRKLAPILMGPTYDAPPPAPGDAAPPSCTDSDAAHPPD